MAKRKLVRTAGHAGPAREKAVAAQQLWDHLKQADLKGELDKSLGGIQHALRVASPGGSSANVFRRPKQ